VSVHWLSVGECCHLTTTRPSSKATAYAAATAAGSAIACANASAVAYAAVTVAYLPDCVARVSTVATVWVVGDRGQPEATTAGCEGWATTQQHQGTQASSSC
jgi:hypothetical protein